LHRAGTPSSLSIWTVYILHSSGDTTPFLFLASFRVALGAPTKRKMGERKEDKGGRRNK
jgi:hypothetical protein